MIGILGSKLIILGLIFFISLIICIYLLVFWVSVAITVPWFSYSIKRSLVIKVCIWLSSLIVKQTTNIINFLHSLSNWVRRTKLHLLLHLSNVICEMHLRVPSQYITNNIFNKVPFRLPSTLVIVLWVLILIKVGLLDKKVI